jgi:uncharacterized damage-inducible protein DinB
MTPEFWLRGPVEGVPPLLMPVAHALLQANADLWSAAGELSSTELWHKPGGAASIGFHLRHIAGSLDRLFTYAGGKALTSEQLAAVAMEGDSGSPPASAEELLGAVDVAIEQAIRRIRETREEILLAPRAVGRARLPTNVLGLLFHAAEHTQRHTGQVITTSKIVRGEVGSMRAVGLEPTT